MSENVKAVRDMYAAFSTGNIPGVLSHLDSDVVWEFEAPPAIGYAGVQRGPDEVLRGFFRTLAAQDKNPNLQMKDFIAEGDKVAVFGRYSATTPTGKSFSTPVAHLWEFRDGKATRFVNIVNTAALLEALS